MQGYLPGQLYNLNSKYGNKEELQALLKAFKEAGVVTLADIVINHRCADAQDENGVWNTFRCLIPLPTLQGSWSTCRGMRVVPRIHLKEGCLLAATLPA